MLKGEREGLGPRKEKIQALYSAAKTENNLEAAFELVDLIYSGEVEEKLIDSFFEGGVAPIFVLPHPAFVVERNLTPEVVPSAGPTNALPFAYAARLQQAIGGEVDSDIVQAARVGRTALNRFQRFLWQPQFVGDVRTDRPYVLVDDAVTIGGTVAALCSHIVRAGGTVAAVTALAHKSGQHQPLALTNRTRHLLDTVYTVGIAQLWKEAIGHEIDCLTEPEGAFLLEWANEHHGSGDGHSRLLALRTRLLKARDQGE
ncbi:hypothetical protein BV98_000113 [Sphingobium herbicidovorans NBRC 16415]|uniref:Phosphoribosyltransferase n=1 Tax=Sphingobium herbicidovorans (strain ATCC 700291 / DSM 11019 / CCUG 56400 / KCTC 2939 / LMG 18315 / NBRC 16415 / MH) TaxID=1219045 RepID=A0A086PEP6_SPHHM|nr:hypothetical protein [Sphingobium herbicidovorans]KFG91864.1 hypothetical protein BV98_000113 [Sphingobium herbicidovorans NBRC 16415]